MADIIYKVNQDTPNSISGFEKYSDEDTALVGSFTINSTFDTDKNYCELHILSLSDELVESNYNYSGLKQSLNAQSAGQPGASVLTIDPVEDVKSYGYTNTGVKLLYHFLNDLYSEDASRVDFYIDSISADRTEISLNTLKIQPEKLVIITSAIKDKLTTQSYFTGFRLNFGQNDLLIATNIDTLDTPAGKVVVVKLYEPLPTMYGVKSVTSIAEVVCDSVAYEVDSQYIAPKVEPPTLRSPNFNLEIADNAVVPTGYLDYNDLFSYPINNSNSQIFSAINEMGAEISVDYSDYNNFIHFSSAQERLMNFKYKLDLINNYSASLSAISINTISGSVGVSGSSDYYKNLLTGVVSNFDHYERFLYYESGSNSWPKSNTASPYINKSSNNVESITWYANQLSTATSYDLTNYNSLVYSIPSFIRDDTNNDNYLTFIYMVGQHFDNLWLYSKAVTDKYDADNRINYGISKDLVGEALRNFGVKLYTSNKSIEDLFTTFIGQAYQSGSEKINHYITGSLTGSNTPIQPTSYDNYNKEVQKRIYHNLPLLLKSKGTERGLRALINCFGIQGDLLDIKYYGGRNNTERPFFGDYQPYTSSLDKIRLDNTGSITSGSTLSINTSIIKRNDKYTDDLHVLEVGFSHVDNIDTYIRANITGSFDIDDYIGDPQSQYENTYSGLSGVANTLLSGSLGTSGSYDLRDYVRLIKFYDNTIFKMVKDFIPARAVADTGIIIKPNLLNRSKAKSVITSGSRPEYTGSIDTAFIAGGHGNVYNVGFAEWSTAYPDTVQTPNGQAIQGYQHLQEQPKYNGELSGSEILVTNGNLTVNNPYLINIEGAHFYSVYFVSSSNEICLLQPTNNITYITSSTDTFNLSDFFSFAVNCNVSESAIAFTPPYTPITFPRNFGNDGYSQYQHFSLSVTDPTKLVTCQASTNLVYGICNIQQSYNSNSVTQYLQGDPTTEYDITTWFNTGPAAIANLQYTASWNDGTDHTVTITNPTAYHFTQDQGTVVTIQVADTGLGNLCKSSIQVFVSTTALGTVNTGSYTNSYHGHHGLQFAFAEATPVTTAQGVESHQFNENLQYVGLTIAGNIHSNSTTANRGIPGYFTPYNYPAQYNLGLGPSTRYTAYTLTCTNANYRTYDTTTAQPGSPVGGWRGNWNIAVHLTADNLLASGLEGSITLDPIPFKDKSAYSYNDAIEEGGEGLFQYLRNGEKSYPTTARYGPYRPFQTGSGTHVQPYALTYQTQVSKTYQEDSSGALVPLWRSKHLLDRAYILRAYQDQHPTSYAQVTVYGDSGILNQEEYNGYTQLPLEGAPYNVVLNGISGMGADDAKYIDIWLLTNWDYSLGTPSGIQNTIYTPPTAGEFDPASIPAPQTNPDGSITTFGPWIKVPIRYFWQPTYPMTEKQQIMYVVGQGWGSNIPGF